MDTDGWTVTKTRAWHDVLGEPAQVVARLRHPEALLQDNDRGAVYRITIDGRPVILKRSKTHERRRWIQILSTMRGGEGTRTFTTLERMRAQGLPVPEPVFAAERREHGRIVESWYACTKVDGDRCTCADAPAVARTLRALHAAGWSHGDPHAANFLRSGTGVTILDCVKARSGASRYARWFDVVLLDKCCPGAARAYPGFTGLQPLYLLARAHSGWYVVWRRIKRLARRVTGYPRLPDLSELSPTPSPMAKDVNVPRLPISAIVITLNEEARIGRCLDSLQGLVSEIVVVDAGSVDRTRAIAETHGARVEVQPWRGFVAQKNLALSRASFPWALCLDADEVVSAELGATIRAAFLSGEPSCDGFAVNRLNAYLGAWIRHVWYPEWRVRLVRTGRAAWTGLDPHDRLETNGVIRRLDGHLLHQPYRDIGDHLSRVVRYARTGAQAYANAGRRARWYHLLLSPWLAFLRQAILRQGWRDGWRGWVIAASTFMKVAARYTFLFELELGRRQSQEVASLAPEAAADAWVEGGDFRTRAGAYDVRLGFNLPAAELSDLASALERPREVFAQTAVLGGRASVWKHRLPSVGPVVIKEFRRGGMLRLLRRKHYLRVGATRPDREFDALRVARAAGVNAPEAVATFVRGGLVYRGWLVTRFIEGRSLVVVGREEPERLPALVERVTWQVLLLIRHRIAHVDLHPGNVLIDDGGTPFLVDFDRAVVFEGSRADLRLQYYTRWTRAVSKHGLPDVMVSAFARGLFDRPRCALVCDEAHCNACRSFPFRPAS